MIERFCETLRLLRLATIVERDQSAASVTSARRRGAGSMSQNQLAHRAQMDPGYVNLLEHGKRKPTREAVLRLARALELDELLEARLLVAAGYWPWPDRAADEIERAVATAAAVMRGDYRPLLAEAVS